MELAQAFNITQRGGAMFILNGERNCCCNLSKLTILILIILQFGRKKECTDEEGNDGQLVDDGVLFIITIFYLCCCNPCKPKAC